MIAGRPLVIALAVLALGGCNPLGLTRYENRQFAYGIGYPSGELVAGPVAADGSGRDFSSRDGRVRARIWSRPASGRDDRDEADDIERGCDGQEAASRRLNEGHLVIECRVGGRNVFHMALVRPDRVVAFRMTYPTGAEARRWRTTAVNMGHSMFARAEATSAKTP